MSDQGDQTLKLIAEAINNLSQTMANIFPTQGGTATSAAAGSAALPANPVGFYVVTLPDGTSVKLPYYAS